MAVTLGILSYLAVAAFYDLRFRKIPNLLIILGMISGVFISILYSGYYGLFEFVFHFIIAIILLFPLYITGVTGAGDIKLLSLICAVMDGKTIIFFLLTVFFTGGGFSLIRIIRAGDHFARLFRLKTYFLGIFQSGKISKYIPGDPAVAYIPFGVCIFIAYFIVAAVHF